MSTRLPNSAPIKFASIMSFRGLAQARQSRPVLAKAKNRTRVIESRPDRDPAGFQKGGYGANQRTLEPDDSGERFGSLATLPK